MAITVKFFAGLSEQFKTRGVQLEAEGCGTVGEVWSRATGDAPMPNHILMAVNHEYARSDAAVRDGDEVAFFPPITGGRR